MTVIYTVVDSIDYSGDSVIGVFDDLGRAITHADTTDFFVDLRTIEAHALNEPGEYPLQPSYRRTPA